MEEQLKVLNRGADVLIATPGRLLDVFERGHLLMTDVKVLVIDEADRMLDMGFIPDVEKIVSTIFEEIINTMAEGDRVELRGFGAFSVKKRDPRIGRNPRTGESVAVEEKHVPFFKTGKLLRDRLNGK